MDKLIPSHAVGPVLIASDIAKKLITAIKKQNKRVDVQDYGSYLRVLVPFQCTLSREAVQEQTGAPFIFPDDLELIMPAFKGQFTVSEDSATWVFIKPSQDN